MLQKNTMIDEENISFEEAYKLLVDAAETVSSENVTLEGAMEKYKEGKKYYDICQRILNEAKQLIEIYDKENGMVKEMRD